MDTKFQHTSNIYELENIDPRYDIQFSAYLNSKSASPIRTSFLKEMGRIKNGVYSEQTMKAREIKATQDDEEYKSWRIKNAYCFTAGVYSSKKGKADPLPEDFTGLVTLDIDLPNQDHKKNKEILKQFDWVLAVAESIGGNALFAIIKCDKTRIEESCDSAIKILNQVGVRAAKGQNNANRIRFCSYDPDIYYTKAPTIAPCVPIDSIKTALPLSIKPTAAENIDSDKPCIFDKIVKIKSAGITQYDVGERHSFLISIISWCNHIGMSENFCLDQCEQVIRPMLVNGGGYNIASQVQDIYSRYREQHGASDWNDDKPEESIPNTLDEFDTYRITLETPVPETPAIITIGGGKVAAAMNITPITAEAKAGKTAVTNVFIAGSISRDGNIDGFNDVSVAPNPSGKAVIHFDTEQSKADQQYNVKTVLRRAGLEQTPDYYRSYNIRTLPLNMYQKFVSEVCKLCHERFNGIHLIVIDGGADFISSVNDEKEATAIIKYFTALAEDYFCPVILVIHLNENAGKNNDTMPRGHVGREAVRKGYSQLNITKEGDASVMQVLRARKAGNADIPLVYFSYSRDKGYHVSLNACEVKDAKAEKADIAKMAQMENLAEKVFGGQRSWLHNQAISEIMKESKKGESTAKTYLKNMVGWGMLEYGADKYYRKVNSGQFGSKLTPEKG